MLVMVGAMEDDSGSQLTPENNMSTQSPKVFLVTNPSSPSINNSYAVNSKIMIVAIVVLFGVVMFILALHIYAKWFWRNGRGRSRRISPRAWRARRRLEFVDDGAENAHGFCQVGLDKSIIENLPSFVFTLKGGGEGFDCAVCLEEFEEGEKGRTLPKCSHSFHTDCIDMWFHSHSTCPLCRCNVVGDAQSSELVYPFTIATAPVDPAVFASLSAMEEPAALAGSSASPQEEWPVDGRRDCSNAKLLGVPANVLFWGSQSHLNAHPMSAQTGENSSQQVPLQLPYLVVEIPRVGLVDGFGTFCNIPLEDESSRSSRSSEVTQGPKSPIGRLMSASFRRLLSLRKSPTSSDSNNCSGDREHAPDTSLHIQV